MSSTIPVTLSGGNGNGAYYAKAVGKGAGAPTFNSSEWTEGTGTVETGITATISGLKADTEYDVYVARAGDGDYNDSAVAKVGTIKTAAGIDVGTFTGLTKTYDGKPIAPTFTPADGVAASDYTIKYCNKDGSNETTTAPTNAGEYKVKAITSKEGYVTVEADLKIEKAPADIEFKPASLKEGDIGEVTAKVVLDPETKLTVKYLVPDAVDAPDAPEENEGEDAEAAPAVASAGTFKTYAEAKEYLNSLKAGEKFTVKVETYAGNDNVNPLAAEGATAEFEVGSKSSGIIISGGNKKPTKPEEKPVKETYVAGNPDGSFAPDRSITRGELATMLARLSKGYDANTTYAAAAVDVGNSYYTNPMNYMASIGVISGYTDGSIQPNGSCTRAEFATMLCRMLNMTPVTTARFSDVSANDWYAGYIGALANAGIISGYNDGTCGPDNRITRAEAVAMINRAFGFSAYSDGEFEVVPTDMNSAHWSYNDVLLAMNTDISELKK